MLIKRALLSPAGLRCLIPIWLRGRASNHSGQYRDVKSLHSAKDMGVKSISCLVRLTQRGCLSVCKHPDLGCLNSACSSFFSTWAHFVSRDVKNNTRGHPCCRYFPRFWVSDPRKTAKITFVQVPHQLEKMMNCSRKFADYFSIQHSSSCRRGTGIHCFLMGSITMPLGSNVMLQLTQSRCGCHVQKDWKA